MPRVRLGWPVVTASNGYGTFWILLLCSITCGNCSDIRRLESNPQYSDFGLQMRVDRLEERVRKCERKP